AGLFLGMSVAENIVVAGLASGPLWVNYRRHKEAADAYRRQLRIACRDVAQPVGELSGGNQQKVVLARWLRVGPRILLIDEPTRGIDVGARAEVYDLLRDLAGRGTAVVIISSDPSEILEVADRVLVLRQGRVAGELLRAEASEERIMQM